MGLLGPDLAPGDEAPGFELPDPDGETVRLADLLADGPAVLYFYPRDGTFGCTREACAFRDDHDAFRDAGARVVGISRDPSDSHRRFREAHDLPFTLLSDVEVRDAYGVDTLGLPGRVTFVVGGDGRIRHVFRSQLRPRRHVEEALAGLDRQP